MKARITKKRLHAIETRENRMSCGGDSRDAFKSIVQKYLHVDMATIMCIRDVLYVLSVRDKRKRACLNLKQASMCDREISQNLTKSDDVCMIYCNWERIFFYAWQVVRSIMLNDHHELKSPNPDFFTFRFISCPAWVCAVSWSAAVARFDAAAMYFPTPVPWTLALLSSPTPDFRATSCIQKEKKK